MVFSSMPGPWLAELPPSDPTFYEDFERLDRLVADLGDERGMPPPTPDQVRRIVEDEAVLGQEPSPAPE